MSETVVVRYETRADAAAGRLLPPVPVMKHSEQEKTMTLPRTASRDEWPAARLKLLEQEKDAMRAQDAVTDTATPRGSASSSATRTASSTPTRRTAGARRSC
ncbi:hypothetical protein Misp03_82580 [Microbispora sp. NBRC 16548]|nr:hypothetical protein Misp03_82580 [Microbispora sp. NBRC 16548]